MQTARSAATNTATILPSHDEMQAFYATGKNVVSEPSFLDFGTATNLYGNGDVVAQGLHMDITSEVSNHGNRASDQAIEDAKKDGQWKPDRQAEKIAENNWEFLDQYLNGTGKDVQEHSHRSDPVLEQFIHSPGADAMRSQFAKMDFPASTDKLGYGSAQAWVDTVLKPVASSILQGFSNLFDGHHLGNVSTEVGGFGHPPKEYPWATASAVRCDANGAPNPNGANVQYQVINVAGYHSWSLHAGEDRPLGSSGPHRSIIQIFRWTEPLQKK